VSKFDSIRPYYDDEVNDVLKSLAVDPNVINAVLSFGGYQVIKKLPFASSMISFLLKNKIKNINSIKSYQDFFKVLVSGVIEKSINNFSVSGLDNIKADSSYLFISNHRDITLDSALLNFSLHENGFKTTNNAVGNNLMNERWASDLMRLNKSFIIDRSDKSKKDIYKSLHLASEFIHNSLIEKNNSIWIAQKQGRSKDGIDYTDPSVLKMIHLNGRKETTESDYFNLLSIVPVSISYEKDPNDLLKANELYSLSCNNEYVKDEKEDLKSIADGIIGQKGNVHLSVGQPLQFNNCNYDEISTIITSEIKSLYKLHSTNIASCRIQGIISPDNNFTEEEINNSVRYLKDRMHAMKDDMQPFFLTQYSNPTL
tara:strand:+ start:5163 stop:6272 length:1110 start_codon:yes stop_codon:yes gene_type:complete